jgi:acetyl-CoA C-acetyltransferase
MKDVVIVSAVRTPIGSFNGSLSSVSATKLGSIVVAEAVNRAGIKKEDVDEVIMGNVLSAGLGQAPARQAALWAGLPYNIGALTINKMCGSGLKAVMLAAQAIIAGDADIVVAGGMENMSQSPYLLGKARTGYRMGHAQLIDSMIKDGLWDVYNDMHMGGCCELCAEELKISREKQDEYAINSYKKALTAEKDGKFKKEIVPVEIPKKKGEPIRVDEDEEPQRANLEKLKNLFPAFKKDGTITAGNASSINDGASAVVVMGADKAKELGVKPLVRIVAQASAGNAPEWFTTAPAEAITRVLKRAGLKPNDIDLYEINEAFSAVAIAVVDKLGINYDKVNINGGAVALGHPIGASGARILTTLIYAMEDRGVNRGVASLCIGGGEAVAVVVERIN